MEDYIKLNPGEEYSEENRYWQGCPSVAVTKGGRLFAAWYSGGMFEPCIDNYNLMVKSDDGGKTWSKPLVVIETDKKRKMRNIDIELWITEENELWIMWVMSPYYETSEKASIKNFKPFDFHKEFNGVTVMVCKNPDAEELVFEEPRYMCKGFLRNKPIKISDGRIIAPAYDWDNEEYYMIRISSDNGKTFEDVKTGKKPQNKVYDESMVYEYDGVLHLLARTNLGYYAKTDSFDGGKTWTETEEFEKAPSTRMYIGVLKSGAVAYVRNVSDEKRNGMKVCLSRDGGKTFPYELVLDDRANLSYPDLDEDDKGNLYIVYDRERNNFIRLNKENWTSDAAKEILLSVVTEKDIESGTLSETSFLSKVISKAKNNNADK